MNCVAKLTKFARWKAEIADEDDELPVIALSGEQQADAWTVRHLKDEDVYLVTGEKIEVRSPHGL